jgi:hypothetical protein
MTLTDKLSTIKGKYHKCMIENVTMLLTGLLTSKTTNLYKMKDDMARIMDIKDLKSGSYYQRLIRFFDRYSSTRLFIDLRQLVQSLHLYKLFSISINLSVIDGSVCAFAFIVENIIVMSNCIRILILSFC